MEPSALIAFSLTFIVAAAVPGPNMAALTARVLGRGREGVPAFCLGLVLGDVIWMSVWAAGFAALAREMHEVFLVVRYLGAAYLLWLAWKLWTAPAVPPEEGSFRDVSNLRLVLGGIALALGNPKIMLFYFSLLPTLIPLDRMTAWGFIELLTTMIASYAVVLVAYVVFAERARRLLRGPRAIRIVNRSTGVVMAGAAATVATQ